MADSKGTDARDADALEVNPAGKQSEQYSPTPVVRDEHSEGAYTRLIEQQTAKVPSDVFLLLALGSMGLSLLLELYGRKESSRFVGMGAQTLLVMGVYNKMVKLIGLK